MVLYDLLLPVTVAFLLAVVLSLFFRPANSPGRAQPSVGALFVFFFAVLFFATWAGGRWVSPLTLGLNWIPLLLIGLIVALSFAVALRATRRRRPSDASVGAPPERLDNTAPVIAPELFGVFFWTMLLLLLGLVFAGYFRGE